MDDEIQVNFVATNPAPILITAEIDTLLGGEGADSFALRNNADQLDIALLQPPATQRGTQGSDSLVGTLNDDFIYGRSGNDTVSSFTGNDFLNGEFGNDLLFSGQGDDIGIGDIGNDTIFGDVGLDSVYGGGGSDVLFGNIDNDTVFGDQNDDTLYGGAGDDILSGGSGSDVILGDRGDDTITGISRRGAGVTLISDFNPEEDQILLPGNSSQYELNRFEDLLVSFPGQAVIGTAIIFINSQGGREIIAIVAGADPLDLNATYFGFI
ncbi:MAG: calcium-binding protein [Oscillatoriales cyanobacterium RM2_1_1]|nr:calcium-binding protein [Oscillatoriales cyanobacterium SM2_3_0]NJO45902.1 calcium-binding protein [Oscillatoriales cyanobacterium RM2_1_1]